MILLKITSVKIKRSLLPIFFCNCLLFILLSHLSGCNTNRKNQDLRESEKLVKKYCTNCHLAPSPLLLDKKTWTDGVLPAMAPQLGIEVLEGNIYLHTKQSVISSQDWTKLISYYKELAPDTLIQKSPLRPAEKSWFTFDLKKPLPDSKEIAATIMTAIYSDNQLIYTSSTNNPSLDQWDKKFQKSSLLTLKSAAVDIAFGKERKVITSMGGMRAMDYTIGEIMLLSESGRKVTSGQLSLNYIRPIQTRPADLNKDGLTDYIVCSFGHTKGGLFWEKQLPDKTFQKLAIREVPGATQTETGDFNGDGWPDVVALFAHGDEGIWLFLNDKKGGFVTRNIVRFPPVFGSSSFQLADMNKDGKVDIIYTAGDNSDYSRILKPYHGLYVFLNRGNFRFTKPDFYPVNGCTKAMAADFDLDGDMDIAMISFFTDLKNNPEQKFMIFKNTFNSDQKRLFLNPVYIPIEKNGRWISMDVNDYDGDGDKDIVLGNFSKGFLNQQDFKADWDTHTPFIVLENHIKTLH